VRSQPLLILAELHRGPEGGGHRFVIEFRTGKRGDAASPIDALAHAGRLVQAQVPHLGDERRDLSGESLPNPGCSPTDDLDFPLEGRMLDPVVQASPLQSIVDIACAVRGDDDDRRLVGVEGAELGNGHRIIGKDLQEQRLELVVRPVDLIDEENGRRPLPGRDRSEHRAAHQESLAVQLVLGSDDIAARLRRPEMQQLAGVVPLVHGLGDVEALVALQADEFASRPSGESTSQFGLSDSGLALEQERSVQAQCEEDGGRQIVTYEVALAVEAGDDVVDRADQEPASSSARRTRTRARWRR
jgi:hypothetical protein